MRVDTPALDCRKSSCREESPVEWKRVTLTEERGGQESAVSQTETASLTDVIKIEQNRIIETKLK